MFLSKMERNLLLLLLFMSFITDGSGQDNGMQSLPDLVYINLQFSVVVCNTYRAQHAAFTKQKSYFLILMIIKTIK